ncbi:ferredoxin [Patescibacteria group bacterium]|nr:ferredoxin [Patescibacteria group bacterium]MBU4480777.1 ferredoxin [Patescibacteria group bacterium]
MKKIIVDNDKCIGCGLCANLCPEVFEIDESNKSRVKAGADMEKNEKCAKESIQSCPVTAISNEPL